MSEQMTAEETPTQVPFWRRNLAPIMAGMILVGTITATSLYAANSEVEVNEARAEVSVVQEEVEVAQEEQHAAEKEHAQAVTGLDVDRKSTDDQAAGQVMSTAMTWSTGQEYNDARKTLINTYNLAPDSSFLTTFLPDQMCNETSTGEQVCMVDTDGLSAKYDSFESTVTDISIDKYSYFALVKMRVMSTDGSTSISQTVPMTYTVDGDGTITDLVAYPVTDDVISTN